LPDLLRRIIHWAIIIHLLTGAAYAFFMVMVILRPEGAGSAPLFTAARTIPHELLVARRLYAIEGWVAFSGLAIYLALTTLRPRPAPQSPAS
jgi:hypothetical protein